MPPVSQRYRDARRGQIVEAARRCVGRSGFRGTFMQDVFAESSLSAGAVYGYFTGKDDLVAAIVEEVIAEIGGALDILADAEPLPVLHEILSTIVQVLDRPSEDELARLAVQVWAEAGRSPELRARLSGSYLRMQARFATLVDRQQRNGTLDPEVSARDCAQVLTALASSFLSQRALLDDFTAETFTRGMTELLTSRPPRRDNGECPQKTFDAGQCRQAVS